MRRDGVRARRGHARWAAAALLSFSIAIGFTHADVWRAGPEVFVLAGPLRQLRVEAPDLLESPVEATARAERNSRLWGSDAVYSAFLVGRHAATLVRSPLRLFDTEHCAPVERSLTLGVPMIALAVLGIPGYLASGDPVFSYNSALLLLALISALSMYALITAWTGVPAAGIAAGLLFSLHPCRLYYIAHPAEWDASWTVLGLLFGERLFARGRWRDAWALGAAGAMQLAATFYQLLAAVLLALPFAAWLVLRYRPSRARLARLGCALGVIALAAALCYGPYLLARSEHPALVRSTFHFASPRFYLPGGILFPGWIVLGLAALGLVAKRRDALLPSVGDPRLALLAGAALVAWLAAGDRLGPHLLADLDLFSALAGVLPGLDSVRMVRRLGFAVILVSTVLAGLGGAALIRWSGRGGRAVAGALVVVAGLAVILPERFGFAQPRGWDLRRARPSEGELSFFAALEREGNSGAILELAGSRLADLPHRPSWNAEGVMLSAYHGRRTSRCYGSFDSPEAERVLALAEALPAAEAVRELRELGFTTVVLQRGAGGPGYAAGLEIAGPRGKRLRRVHEDRSRVAFELPAPGG